MANLENLIDLLQICRQKKNPIQAKHLHARMQEYNVDTHRIVGNYLVPMLVDCGCLSDAQFVFDRLAYKNHCSWNCLIWGYIHNGELQHAFHLYSKMQENHLLPNSHTYVALLKASTILSEEDIGRNLHGDIVVTGLENDVFVGNTLVDMYGKCGSPTEACYVFDRLAAPDFISWNSMITVYADHGLGKEALDCFEQMQLHNMCPDVVTFVCSLKACASIVNIEKGLRMCVEISKLGLETNFIIGSAMVDMYSKCGWLLEARQVLDLMPSRNVISWTAMIGGYAESGLAEKVLDCFEQMELEGVSPNAYTYICSLKACSNTGSLKRGLEIGRHIRDKIYEKGFDTMLLVNNSLLAMFCKRGSMQEAHATIEKLAVRDIVSWNALISGYAELLQGEEAIMCVRQMKLEGFSPDVITFVCCLKACDNILGNESWQLCTEIVKVGLERNLPIGCAMLDMYCRCGFIMEALQTFERLAVRDAISWNSMILGYAEYGYAEAALGCLHLMKVHGIFPDDITLVGGLKACGAMDASEAGQEIHTDIIRRGYDKELYVSNTVVAMYTKCGLVCEARSVFDKLSSRCMVSWAALISGYSEQELDEKVLDLFEQMILEGVCFDTVTFVRCLKSCGIVGALDVGRKIHCEVWKLGLEDDIFVGNTLVDMYVKCGSLVEGCEVFNKLPVKDIVSWNAMIRGYGENNESCKAIQCFTKMLDHGVKPNSITFLGLLVACSHASLVVRGHEYFKMMNTSGIEPQSDHYSCMVDLFARSGCFYEADKFLKAIKDVHPKETLNAFLSACRFYGTVGHGLQCFQKLVEANKEDAAPYLLMAETYASAGQLVDAQRMEDLRKQARAVKMPGSASIELNEKLYGFFVCDNQSIVPSMACSSRLRKEGYVPILDLISTYVIHDVNIRSLV